MRKKMLLAFCLFFCFTVYAHALLVRYAIIPEDPRPGEPVTIAVSNESGAKSAALMLDGKRLTRAAFFPVAGEDGGQSFMAAVMTIPATARPGKALIAVEAAAGIIDEIALTISGREFDSEVIELNPVLTGIRTEPDPQKTREANHLWAILNRTSIDTGNGDAGQKNAWHFGNFSPPVTSTRRTSVFGARRVFKYSNGTSDTSIHAGIDYGVRTGTEVRACGAGRVVLARNRIVTGNSVIIEHLPGLYSLYYHLDSIAVSEDSLVDTGTLLGQSGATGLATGPHLHWEIRVSGENTDPDAFIARPLIDKDAILGKMYPID